MILEIEEQLQAKPKAIFCSVGGGGLLGGILLGTEQVGWSDGESLVFCIGNLSIIVSI
jgi:L-serine/L-threonine ammonia-lyase